MASMELKGWRRSCMRSRTSSSEDDPGVIVSKNGSVSIRTACAADIFGIFPPHAQKLISTASSTIVIIGERDFIPPKRSSRQGKTFELCNRELPHACATTMSLLATNRRHFTVDGAKVVA